MQGEDLVEMAEEAYASEDLLQELLAKYPNLLAGDQIDATEPRRWLLVSREMSLASEEDGAGRWSVDHLFLDQDAVPTIVEVKRSTDTRIRREVVGQMLDYAANAVVYWPVERLRARFEAGREDHEHALTELLEDTEADLEGFWQKIKTNLQAGRVRLIFVSDEISTELRRIVEFLNEQMDPAEVLAVEIKQYVSRNSNLKTLIPRVIGQTVEAQQKKSGSGSVRRPLDEESLLREIEIRQGANEAEVAKKALEWAKKNSSDIWWGTEQFTSLLRLKGQIHRPLAVTKFGVLKINLGTYRKLSLPDSDGKAQQFLDRLDNGPSTLIPTTTKEDIVEIGVTALRNQADLRCFLDALDWLVDEIKKS